MEDFSNGEEEKNNKEKRIFNCSKQGKGLYQEQKDDDLIGISWGTERQSLLHTGLCNCKNKRQSPNHCQGSGPVSNQLTSSDLISVY